MTESPRQKARVFSQYNGKERSKFPLKGKAVPESSSAPVGNVRRRMMQYELGGIATSEDLVSFPSSFPESTDDYKENDVSTVKEKNYSYSPLTLDTDIPVHPLQYHLKQGNDDLAVTPLGDRTPRDGSCTNQFSHPRRQISDGKNPCDIRFGPISPDVSCLGTPTSQYQNLSDSKIKKRRQNHDRKMKSPFKMGGTRSPNNKSPFKIGGVRSPNNKSPFKMGSVRSPNNNKSLFKIGSIRSPNNSFIARSMKINSNSDERSDSSYLLGTLGERLQVPDFDRNNGPETTIVFSNNSTSRANNLEDEHSSSHNRDEESENDEGRDEFVQIMSRTRSVSEIHNLCASMTTVGDIVRAKSFLFGMSLHEASKRNYKGETILHGFSNNKALATIIGNPNNEHYETKDFLTLFRQPSIDKNSTDQLNKLVETFFVDELLPSFFGAPIAQDHNGQIPFEASLIDWVATCHKEMYGISAETDMGYFSTYSNRVSDVVTHAWESTSTTFLSAIPFGNRSASKMQKRQSALQNDIERGDSMSSSGSVSSRSIGVSKFTPHARFCLRMLSLVLDEFDNFTRSFAIVGMNRQKEKYSNAIKGIQQLENVTGPLDLSGRVVEKIASIPYFLEVIFSINNEADLEFALSTKIIKRILVDKHSVGPWVTTMLQSSNQHLSQRAIMYLHTVSNLCSRNQKSQNKNPTDESSFEPIYYEDLVDEVSRLDDFVPSLLALGDKVIEEVSTTLIVSKVMDRMIARPFVATVVFFDAIFLFLMIGGFRSAVNGMIMGDDLDTVLAWIYVANTGIFYFIIGEIGKFVSLFLLSKHSRNYILSFWNLVDFLAIFFAAISSITMRWQFTIGDETGIENNDVLRGFLAVTTGFLWLRVLNFLKAINMQLATFVLAILQITKDIFWFCIILLTLIVSFSQMFFTLLAPPSCSTNDSSGPQCQQSEYLLGVYTILLGDFGIFARGDFATGFSVFLVVLYSFLVTVVLLNVLIAIASDSYEKCLLKSQKLFGRARVMLIAELASFQSLLRRIDQDADSPGSPTGEGAVYSKWWTSTGLTHNWSRGSTLFFSLSLLVTVCWTFAELVGYVQGIQVGNIVMSFSSVLINTFLYVIIMIFLDRSASSSASHKDSLDGKSGWDASLQKSVHWLFGVSRRSKKVSSRFSRGQDAWHGRVEFLQREMDHNAERQAELVRSQSESLQGIINISETRVRTEISQIDEKFKSLESSVKDELKETREINANLLSAVRELRVLISLAEGSVTDKTPQATGDVLGEVNLENM